MYNKIKSSLDISRREYRGMIVVFIVFILIYCFPYVYEHFIKEPLDFRIEILQPHINEIAKFSHKDEASGSEKEETISLVSEHVLFDFNPNNLPIDDWVKLGLSEKQAAAIKKYEAKGGKFYKKEDLKKMYSISEKQYNRLEPYIKIPTTDKVYEKKYPKKEELSSTMIDINSVDSFSIQLVKGIGPAFASRIIKYRDRLGGFVDKEQLMEVYGVDSVKFQQISPHINIDAENIAFININTVTIDEFKKFPYLTYRQKNVLLAYRKHHGNYKTLSELQKAAILTSETVEKIAPYIKF